ENSLRLRKRHQSWVGRFLVYFGEDFTPVGLESTSTEGMHCSEGVGGILVRTAQGLPAYPSVQELIDDTNLKKIEKRQGCRVVNGLERTFDYREGLTIS